MASSEWLALHYSPFATHYSPFLPLFAERADFHLERPGAFRLLVELPIGARDRGRRHQQVRIVQRLLAPYLFAALAHPGGVNAGIDDEMRDMNVLRPQFARHRLRDPAQAELGAGKGGKAAAAAK